MNNDSIILTSNLTKLYAGKPAVSSLHMHVKKGDIYGFIGRNGLRQIHYPENALRACRSQRRHRPAVR